MALAVLIILIGAGLRIVMLARDVRLHPDEALYATYARSMALQGDWLLRDVVVALDKPPLGLALTALGFTLTGVSEFSGRWPTVLISMIGLAAGYALARRLYDERTALITLLLLALSPFDVAFAATLFHDPALTLWLILTAWGLASGKWRLAGIAAVLALWTKQSAIQFLPIFALISVSRLPSWSWRATRRFIVRFMVTLIVGIGLLAWWSAARAVSVDFWSLGVINPGALRLIRSDEVLPRFGRWIEMLGYAVGSVPMLVIALLPLVRRAKQANEAITDTVIGISVIGTLLLYWLLAYNTYDRYLLPLVVLIVLLVARGLRRLPRLVTVIVVLAMLPVTWQALHSQIGVGVAADTARGIDMLAARIRTLPSDALIHQYWVDWELGFYLGDPAVEHLPILMYQPSPEALARFVCDHTDRRHYLALPSAMLPRWVAVLRDETSVTFAPVLESPFSLYAIQCTTAVSPAEG
jgi:4-amino-4-deoxy-L-arabinose transferase-like glycosyltransferase